eukprot:jgi/Pico_ML_1/54677/g552.t1
MAAPATPYIGAQISLVSKSEIRYEGTLHFVDAEQSTLALKNGEHSTGDVVVADVAQEKLVDSRTTVGIA